MKLARVLVVAGAVVVAGCNGGGDDSTASDADQHSVSNPAPAPQGGNGNMPQAQQGGHFVNPNAGEVKAGTKAGG